jgi:hypothetical protein
MIDIKFDEFLHDTVPAKFETPKFVFPLNTKGIDLFTRIGSKLIGKQYIIDDYNKEFINQLMSWFFNRETFNGDLSKGLFIKSKVGRGKSVALQIMYYLTRWYRQQNAQYNKLFNYREMLEEECSVKFNKDYSLDINLFNGNPTSLINLYNDVGREGVTYSVETPITTADKVVKRFGNDINTFAVLFEQEYLRFQKLQKPTIIITNHDELKYKTWYGVEIFSRLQEMFNFIELDGFDRRVKI